LRRRLVPWAVIVVATLAYPLAVLAGGLPRFPSRSDCIHHAKSGQPLEAVFGRFARQDAADASLSRVLKLGFAGSQIESDGCGYLKVAVHGIPTLAAGQGLIAEARRAGLDAHLETSTP